MPGITEVHTDTYLSEVAEKFPSQDFVVSALLPFAPVRKASDTYFKLDTERKALREIDTHRAPGNEANVVDWATGSGTYSCVPHALAHKLPDEVRDNQDQPIIDEVNAVEWLTEQLYLQMEIKAAAALAAGVTTNASDINATPWNSDANGDPISNFNTAHAAIEEAVGMHANVFVCDQKVFRALRNHTDIVERVKGGATPENSATINEQVLAEILDVDRVVVARNLKNTAIEGQTASLSRIWGQTAYLAFVNPRPSRQNISLGYSFVWNRSGAVNGWVTTMWRNDPAQSDMFQVDVSYDQKIMAETAAYKWTNTLGG